MTFRAAFRELESALGASTPAQRLDARISLDNLLGSEAAGALLRRFDPEAAVLSRTLVALGVSIAAVDQAYSIVAQARESIVGLLSDAAPISGSLVSPGSDVLRQVAEMRRREASELRALLGDGIARQLENARRELAEEASAGGAVPASCG